MLHNGQGWPRSSAYRAKKYEELLARSQGWPDRVLTIEEAFAKQESVKQDEELSHDGSEL